MNKISMIVAKGENNVIGDNNELIWSIPNDLKYFKKITSENTIVMGRKTYESIGKPLPNRRNIVLTNNEDFYEDGVEVVHSIDEILNLKEDVIIIGGDSIYRQFMRYADKLYVTEIKEYFSGDTYFPEIDVDRWNLVKSEVGLKNNENPYEYYFNVYERM